MRAGACIWRLVSPVLVAAFVVACASPPRPDWTPVPIKDIASVSGKWAGILLREPPDRRDDWLELRIAPDGSFEAKSVRLIGTMTGTGKVALADGKLAGKTANASMTGALYTAGNRRMLRVDAKTTEGLVFWSETTPVQ
jgi:hypothetical protein